MYASLPRPRSVTWCIHYSGYNEITSLRYGLYSIGRSSQGEYTYYIREISRWIGIVKNNAGKKNKKASKCKINMVRWIISISSLMKASNKNKMNVLLNIAGLVRFSKVFLLSISVDFQCYFCTIAYNTLHTNIFAPRHAYSERDCTRGVVSEGDGINSACTNPILKGSAYKERTIINKQTT